MPAKFESESFFAFLAEHVDSTARQLVVQIRDEKVESHLYFQVHGCSIQVLYWSMTANDKDTERGNVSRVVYCYRVSEGESERESRK